jgi:hypothetical protein
MAHMRNTGRDDELAKIRAFDKVWDLLDRIRNDAEIEVHMGIISRTRLINP